MAWSACSSTQKKGVLATTMPSSVARATSMRSVPAPMRAMARQRVIASMIGAGR